MNKINNSLFEIPQVVLLTKGPNFKATISFLIKKIICLDNNTCLVTLCENCQKIENKSYFDLKWVRFTNTSFLKKQDTLNIIEELLICNIEKNSPKICVIEQIEFSTIEASNVFLKFLENLNENIYLIFTTNNIKAILPTILSRCQILDLEIKEDKIQTSTSTNEKAQLLIALGETFNFDFHEVDISELEIILKLVNNFIENDNKNDFNSNFFLIKELVNLKQKGILFLKILFLLVQKKLVTLTLNPDVEKNLIFQKILETWTNDNKQFLSSFLEKIILVENQFTNKVNINLLFNHFFINIYRDIHNDN